MRYIEYFLFLRSKDASGYNGIEYYVAKCLDDKNINFLPGENTRFLLTANGTQGAANKRKDEMAKFVDALDELVSNFHTSEPIKNSEIFKKFDFFVFSIFSVFGIFLN